MERRKMNILVTGANGFVGKNLCEQLKIMKDVNVFKYDIDSSLEDLERYAKDCDLIYHLAGVNRPKDEKEFMEGNCDFTKVLLDILSKTGNTPVIAVSSSIQALLDNPYGKSKRAGEDLIFDYSKKTGARVVVYRFPNVYGKWCRPNYNSAVATFCNNIANDLPITVNDPSVMMHLVYIDDVVEELLSVIDKNEHVKDGYGFVPKVTDVPLGKIPELLYYFKESRKSLRLPNLCNPFEKKLYSTYLSYLPEDGFSYPLLMHEDNRGSFTEFLKSDDRGQVSVNISHPGIVKGNHWHNTKNEKFLVVSGKGMIKLRKVGTDKVLEYPVSGEKLEVIDIPCGYTHSIANVGDCDMVTVMWVNEVFDESHPDTYFEEV